jgi:dTDP-glucose 4,6-dehydratase
LFLVILLTQKPLVMRLRKASDDAANFAAETRLDGRMKGKSLLFEQTCWGSACGRDADRVPRFVHISTDKIYGNAKAGNSFTEDATLDSRSPDGASKASANHRRETGSDPAARAGIWSSDWTSSDDKIC